ncbi:hypothetical protein ACWEWU_14555 [Staphylococcus xylosus]
MVIKIKTITNETYTVDTSDVSTSFDDFMKKYVMQDGYLKVKDVIKRTTWINTQNIESVRRVLND